MFRAPLFEEKKGNKLCGRSISCAADKFENKYASVNFRPRSLAYNMQLKIDSNHFEG